MIYAVTYEIDGICGPGGTVDTSRETVVDFAKELAQTALDQLDDAVSFLDWFGPGGEEVDPREVLRSDDVDEVADMVKQVSEAMKCHPLGYIDLWEYEDIFQLIKDQDVTSWCSTSLKDRIADARKAYFGLVNELADEWIGI